MDGSAWAGIVVGLLGLSAIGTRALAWFVANRRYLLIVADVIERLAGGRGPGSLKGDIGGSSDAAGSAVRALGEAVAARAEKRAGVSGQATALRKVTKGKRALGEVRRWLPIVGAFL